jgi:hypothetical protein
MESVAGQWVGCVVLRGGGRWEVNGGGGEKYLMVI